MPVLSIRAPRKVAPVRTARPNPSQRTYAHAARLYVRRGNAPTRNVLLRALFAKPGTKPKRLNFHGPTTTLRDEINDMAPVLVEPVVMIDRKRRLYFFDRRDIGTLSEGEQIHAYYMLQSSRNEDGAPVREGDDSIALYDVDYNSLLEYAPKPTPEQRSRACPGGVRRPYNVIRFENADWSGLIDHLSASTQHRTRMFIIDRVGRKYRMTTGRVYLTAI